MWIAFPSTKWSLKDPLRTGTVRFSPTTAALASSTQGSENLPSTDDPAEPANTYRCTFAFLHFFDLHLFPAAFLPFAFLHFFFFFDLHLFPAALPFAHFTIAVVPAP